MSKRLKYCLSIVFIFALICTVAFAAEPTNTPSAPYEIISPKINANGDVIKEQHLLISLRINQVLDATLTLTRLDEPRVVVASELAKKLSTIALQAPDTPVAEGTGIDPVVVVTKKDVLADENSKEVVQDAYYKAGQILALAYDDYISTYIVAKKSVDAEKLNLYIAQRKLLQHNLKNLHVARQAYEKAAKIYIQLGRKHEALYRVNVINNAPIVLQGALPIFNCTVKDIQIGKYEIVVENANTGKVIGEKVTFMIKDKENAAVEIIEKVKEEMSGIFKTE